MYDKNVSVGLQIGNALIDLEDYQKGYYDFLGRHALISNETHQGILKSCDFSLNGTKSDECYDYLSEALDSEGRIFPYNIYASWCSSSFSSSSSVKNLGRLLNLVILVLTSMSFHV